MRAALNIGFTVGALIGGLALATNSDAVVRAVPLLTGASWSRTRTGSPGCPARPRRPRTHRRRVVKPRRAEEPGFLALMTVCDGVLGTNQVLLNVVIPLWLVEETDAPRVLLAWLFGTNTVMAVLLQVAALAASTPSPGRCGRCGHRRLLRAVLRHRAGHPRHRRLGDDRAGLARARDGDRRRAVPVGRPLGASAGAVRRRPRAEYQGAARSAAPSARCGRRRSSPGWRWSTGRSAGSRSRPSRRSRRSPWDRRPGPRSATSHGTARRPDRSRPRSYAVGSRP